MNISWGVNYPVFKKVAYDLGSTDNRPLRRVQFFDMIGNVNNEEDAKSIDYPHSR